MKRYKHNIGSYNLLTADMGELIPIGLTEVLPADTVQHRTSMLIRLSPLASPVMHPVKVRIHHWFVPHRLVWDGTKTGDAADSNWEDFITGGADGNNSDQVPTIPNTNQAKNVLDYFGLNPQSSGALNVSALPVRGYNLIYNEFYRDQDLVSERALTDTTVARVAWEKDYFTGSRPWTQKGSDVTIPLGEKAPVHGLGKINQNFPSTNTDVYETGGSGTQTYAASARIQSTTNDHAVYMEEDPDNAGYPNVWADLANAVGANVNDVRRAFAIQRYQEARARYGSRYAEYLRYLGARPMDSRLQRPEFLGGGRAMINFSEIMQTGPESGTPTRAFGVGDMYGHGISGMSSRTYRRTMNEHGYIISLLSVRPKVMYNEAVDRHWLRTIKEDFFQRELQHIGQQPVWKGEAYNLSADPKGVFGYQDRYREYRESASHVTSEFRDTLDYWHLARKLATEPTLNASYIECKPSKRIHNEQTLNQMWIMAQHHMVARRLVERSAYAKLY